MLDIKNLNIDYQLKNEELVKEMQFLQEFSNQNNDTHNIEDTEEITKD